MKYIMEFYKELDTVNLIVFWGTIIVVILLLTFSIIMANKNKKLKYIIESKGIDIDNYDYDEELAIKKDVHEENIHITKQTENITQNRLIIETNNEDIPILKQESKEEKFTPEELVMEYNKNEPIENTNNHYEEHKEAIKQELSNTNYNNFQTENNKSNYEKNIEIEKQTVISNKEKNTANIYQNNIRNEVLSRQTSPIGIIEKEDNNLKEINKARELQNNLHYNDTVENNHINSIERQREIAEAVRKSDIYEERQQPRGNYLEEISKSLSKINGEESIGRTSYELKQEEDAIISYKELMEKKDSIQTIDEEDAVISIGELMAKKQAEDKLYGITNDAEDDKFINELKNFRSDL